MERHRQAARRSVQMQGCRPGHGAGGAYRQHCLAGKLPPFSAEWGPQRSHVHLDALEVGADLVGLGVLQNDLELQGLQGTNRVRRD